MAHDHEQPTVDSAVLARAVVASPDAQALVVASVRNGRDAFAVRWINEAARSLLGRGPCESSGFDLVSLLGGAGAEEIEHLIATGAAADTEIQLRRSDGSVAPTRAVVLPLGEVEGARCWIITLQERSAELRVREHLAASEDRFRALAEHAPIGIFRSDLGLRLGYANARCAEILGVAVADLNGAAWIDRFVQEERERLIEALHVVLGGQEVELHQVRAQRPDGVVRWIDIRVAPVRTEDRAAGFVGSLEDVTDRRLLEQTLAHDATHDRLTGLPNRTLLWDRLESALSVPSPEVAVLFLDLDDFKLVNDSLGHEAGDELLLAVSERLRCAIRPGDLVTRFGGDEFVVVCEHVRSRGQAEMIASRLAQALADPVQVAGREVLVTASIGVVTGEQSSHDPESLLRDADIALYQAKGAGKARWAVFDERVREDTSERLAMAQELRRAIDTGGVTVVYQPIVDLSTDEIVAVEALSRWTSERFGTVSPARFVALAEETGLIDRLGDRVLNAACEQVARWREELGPLAPSYVSVNVSARQLADPSIVDRVLQVLRDNRLDASSLCIELTESAFVTDLEQAMSLLAELKAFGVRLALDDFGTGYSSLSYLRRFPGDYVKVDRSFVSGLRDGGSSLAIMRSVIELATALGLRAVGEGVETGDEAATLFRMGCAYGQGWHLGKPMPASGIADLLLAGRVELRAEEEAGT